MIRALQSFGKQVDNTVNTHWIKKKNEKSQNLNFARLFARLAAIYLICSANLYHYLLCTESLRNKINTDFTFNNKDWSFVKAGEWEEGGIKVDCSVHYV